MKKLFALLLAVCMLATMMVGCNKNPGGPAGYVGTDTVGSEYELITVEGSDIQYKKYADMTTEEITLTYFHFDQDETVKYLAERFMQIYPNIKVEVVWNEVGTYNDTLLTLVNSQKTPDVVMYSDADFALANFILSDIKSYWDSDAETKNLADTINDAGLGTFNTSGRFGVPVKFFPSAVYVDLGVLETLNLEAPTQNWTWAEMIDLIKKATVLDSPDGMAYYGLGFYNRLDSYYGIASSQDIIGEFGFDGTDFNLAAWAVGEQEFAGLKLGGYIAPSPETEAMEAWMGDWEGWCGASGHTAMFSEAFWTFQNIWNEPTWKENNPTIEVVPYVIPAVSEEDASSSHHAIATIDFGGISSSCTYRREAYELLKFMSFGIDGWKTRIELYCNPESVNASGIHLKHDVMPVPTTKDEEVWAAYEEMFCEGMSDESKAHWSNYFDSVMNPIPYGWTAIAGYWNFCDQYFNSIGIHDLVDNGTAQAADYVEEATRKVNYYHAQAMLDYFGPTGYNILSQEEIDLYTKMVEDNS